MDSLKPFLGHSKQEQEAKVSLVFCRETEGVNQWDWTQFAATASLLVVLVCVCVLKYRKNNGCWVHVCSFRFVFVGLSPPKNNQAVSFLFRMTFALSSKSNFDPVKSPQKRFKTTRRSWARLPFPESLPNDVPAFGGILPPCRLVFNSSIWFHRHRNVTRCLYESSKHGKSE